MSAPIQRPASNSEARKAAASKALAGSPDGMVQALFVDPGAVVTEAQVRAVADFHSRAVLAALDTPSPAAAAVRAAQAEALREAADEWEQEDTDAVGDWLRDRADRLATDTAAPEGFVDGSDFIDSLAAPVAVEGVETVEWGVLYGGLETSEPEGRICTCGASEHSPAQHLRPCPLSESEGGESRG